MSAPDSGEAECVVAGCCCSSVQDGDVVLTVVKKGSSKVETEIDGVTGATLTSNGVGAMVTEGLNAYKEFLNK